MRKLNSKQKKILDRFFEGNKDRLGVFFDCETDLPDELYEECYNLNKFEIFNQAANIYVNDLLSDYVYGGSK